MLLALKVNPQIGSDIRDVCCEAVALADKLHIDIDFDFNDVHVMVSPGDRVEQLVMAWTDAVKKQRRFAIIRR